MIDATVIPPSAEVQLHGLRSLAETALSLIREAEQEGSDRGA